MIVCASFSSIYVARANDVCPVHSVSPYAEYFEHLRGEKDAIARKALADKCKLESEIVELRRKCMVRDCRRRCCHPIALGASLH